MMKFGYGIAMGGVVMPYKVGLICLAMRRKEGSVIPENCDPACCYYEEYGNGMGGLPMPYRLREYSIGKVFFPMP